MTKSRFGRAYACVVVDLNTQVDLCTPEGAHPVANCGELYPVLRRVIAWIRRNHAPVVSSIESHRPAEVADNGHSLYCVDGSPGQRKLDFTLFPLHLMVEVDNTFGLPLDLFWHWQQVLFRKRTEDLLTNPKADRFLTHLPVKEYLLFGTGVERSIKALALGLLAREKNVTIVADACGYWHKPTADLSMRQMAAKGATLIGVDELCARKLDRRRRYSARAAADSGSASSNGRLPKPDARRTAQPPGRRHRAVPDYQI